MMSHDTRSYSISGRKILAFVLLFLVFYHAFSPLKFNSHIAGLDRSWQAALTYSLERGLVFGRDTVFTGGPLSSLYTRQFSAISAYPVAILSLLIVVFISTVWWRLLDTRIGLGWIVLVYITLALMIVPLDTSLLLVPFLAGLNGLNRERSGRGITAAGAFLSGVIILAKFSVFPMAVLSMLVLDVVAVAKRRVPFHLAICAAGLCCGFVACGQSLSQLPTFMSASLDVTSGYSSAMSLKGHFVELLSWLVIATGFIGTLLITIRNNRRDYGLGLPLARLVLFSAYLFISFKAGLVRHDLHSLIAWSALGLTILLASHPLIEMPKPTARVFVVLALILVVPGNALSYLAKVDLPFSNISGIPAQASKELETAARFVFQPTRWLDNLKALDDASMADMRTQTPLPTLNGTVDVIDSTQSNLIASGLAYRPRPTIQEYTTYSRKLIAGNRDFFMGDTAPEYLIMKPGSIDGRHPASAEGALWPLFFARYEPMQFSALGLVLKKRPIPIADVTGKSVDKTVTFGERVVFPDDTKTWMVSIDIKPTILGRLVDILYRPPMTGISVRYIDGSSETYRLIPAMAGEGMILSPYVGSATDYLIVSTGNTEFPGLKHAQSFTVDTGLGAGIFYRSTFDVRFSAMDSQNLRNNENVFTHTTLERSTRVLPLLAHNEIHEPMIVRTAEGIFAHAPATLRLPVTSGAEITVYFGMLDGSWSAGGRSDGVCFALRSSSGQFAEKCLDPVRNVSDRGEQAMKAIVPPGTSEIQLETTCRETCAWDWSYWGGVENSAH